MPLESFYARVGANALGEEDRRVMNSLISATREFGSGTTIMEPDEHPNHVHFVETGWAIRRLILEDGSSQITDFLLPGDACDLPTLVGGATDWISALTTVKIVLLDRIALLDAMATRPNIAQAILRSSFCEQLVLRAWVGCFGLQEKREHTAHLLCELHWRLARIGLTQDHEFNLPLTQNDLALALGMTAVHTNRVLQSMRRDGLIALRSRHLRILQPDRLREIAAFDDGYLLAWNGHSERLN